jgi:hypothetical protein
LSSPTRTPKRNKEKGGKGGRREKKTKKKGFLWTKLGALL